MGSYEKKCNLQEIKHPKKSFVNETSKIFLAFSHLHINLLNHLNKDNAGHVFCAHIFSLDSLTKEDMFEYLYKINIYTSFKWSEQQCINSFY